MMKRLTIIFLLLSVMLVFSGCTQTPANVAKEVVPSTLKNVSADIAAMETPNITLDSVLKPLQTSSAYIQPSTLTSIVKDHQPEDPIVGNWRLVGDSGYDCTAAFTSDSNGQVSCSSWGVPLIFNSFIWTPESNTFSWLRNYTLTDTMNRQNYTVAYSDRTGRLTSEIIPGSGYLVKVG
jgi:hypothetical protein